MNFINGLMNVFNSIWLGELTAIVIILGIPFLIFSIMYWRANYD